MNNLLTITLQIWFKVSYAEKDKAKALKCRWSPENKAWYTTIKHDSLTQLLEDPFENFHPRFSALKFDRITTPDAYLDEKDRQFLTTTFISLQKSNAKLLIDEKIAKDAQDAQDALDYENAPEYFSDSD